MEALNRVVAAIKEVPESEGAVHHYVNDNREKLVSIMLSRYAINNYCVAVLL